MSKTTKKNIQESIRKTTEKISNMTKKEREEFDRNYNMFGSNPTPQMIIDSMLDLLIYEKNRNEVTLILKDMFTGDDEKDNQFFEKGCKLLLELSEVDILENIGYDI